MSPIALDNLDHHLATVAKRYISRRHLFIVWLDSPGRYVEEYVSRLGLYRQRSAVLLGLRDFFRGVQSYCEVLFRVHANTT
jgi:hypothetical protein